MLSAATEQECLKENKANADDHQSVSCAPQRIPAPGGGSGVASREGGRSIRSLTWSCPGFDPAARNDGVLRRPAAKSLASPAAWVSWQLGMKGDRGLSP